MLEQLSAVLLFQENNYLLPTIDLKTLIMYVH